MTFTTFKFALFILVVLGAYWAAYRHRNIRTAVLVAGSYFFYASFNPWFLILLLYVSLADWAIGGKIASESRQGHRKFWLIVSLTTNLGLLAAFKYLNFLINVPADVAELFGRFPERSEFRLPMAVGISFYLFQTISYTVDVYRKRIEPCSRLIDYLLYMAFFPRILAGPIVRAGQFLPQLAKIPVLTPERRGLALFFLMSGFVKKLVIADYLSLNLVDRVFDLPLMYSTTEVILAIYGYTIQIYCDFSGYTDIALGIALLFGIELPENFRFPYKAVSLRDFWRRWHKTLSFWLRDYLYISLGGSKNQASWKIYRNLMITMLLGGLWHGAAWTFIIWGFLHGLALAVTRAYQRFRQDRGWTPSTSRFVHALAVFFTFQYVALAWVFFRASELQVVWDMLSQLRMAAWSAPNLSMNAVYVMIAAVVGMWFPDKAYLAVRSFFIRLPYPIQVIVVLVIFYLIFQVAAADVAPFVYEQF